jgi:uncharacterized repeat protein (TIGR01451 family)/fimbrial isopeptide formation D2 family protein
LTVSRTQSPFRALPVLIAVFFNLVAGPALPILTSATHGPAHATATLEEGIAGCEGVKTTPGSENTTKELIGGTLEPGGTAIFRFTFPAEVDGNPGQEEWKITDCVFLNDDPIQKYTVTALANDVSPVVIDFQLTIPSDAPIGAEYCNYGKTTETPSDAQASNRKAGPACFIVGGALRIEKQDASGAPLAGATFTVTCNWPDVSPGTFLPDTILSAPTNGTITPPGGVSTVTLDSTDDGSFTRTVVTGDLGVITVNGPVGTECTFTETAAPPGYLAPTPPDNTVTLTIDDAGQQIHTFVNVLPPPNLTISKTPDGGTVNAGDPISFTITVSNAGPGVATNVDIDDTLPAGFEWVESPDKAECTIVLNVLHCDIASLASGANFSVTVTSPTQAADCGLVTNTATADADNHAQVTNSGNQTVQCPGLNVVKEADPGNIVAGDTAGFDIVVWNTGPGTALNVTLHDVLPSGIVWTEDSADCEILAGVLDCDFGDLGVTTVLNSPARVTVSGATDRQDCGELDNTAIADADNDEEVEASASITVRCPTLVIDKAANVELITKTLDPQGNVIDIDPEVVTWTLTYTVTEGPVTNAVITDTIPAGLTYVNGSASNGGVYNAATRTLTWTFPTLSAGGSVTFQTTVNQDAPAGVILNVATIDSEETGPDEGQDSIRIVEDQQLGGTSSAQPSLPSTALNQPSSGGSMAALLFGMILIAALGGLAYVNVVAVRRRR